MSAPARMRTSLCCRCGNVNSVRASRRPRGGWKPEGYSEETIQWFVDQASRETTKVAARSLELWSRAQPWHRCTELLDCEVCVAETVHAFLRDDAFRDCAEEEDYPATSTR